MNIVEFSKILKDYPWIVQAEFFSFHLNLHEDLPESITVHEVDDELMKTIPKKIEDNNDSDRDFQLRINLVYEKDEDFLVSPVPEDCYYKAEYVYEEEYEECCYGAPEFVVHNEGKPLDQILENYIYKDLLKFILVIEVSSEIVFRIYKV